MSKFCRHGALAERCPICQPAAEAAARRPATLRRSATDNRPRRNLSSRGGLIVRREARALDDGYRSPLAPGLRASDDARRLAAEIAFAAARLATLERDPPGLYGVVATEPDLEEATWLAFLIAYLGPLEAADPFAAIAAARTPWASRSTPLLEAVELGPRAAHDPGRGAATIDAYRRFADRAGSQRQAFIGDQAWTGEQRFERIHERLALPGLHGRARYDLLVTLGRLGRYPLTAPALLVTEDDPVTAAAKRVFGIGDRMTLERRARDLAGVAGVPVEALDLGLENWARATRITQGVPVPADEQARARVLAALGCDAG